MQNPTRSGQLTGAANASDRTVLIPNNRLMGDRGSLGSLIYNKCDESLLTGTEPN